MLSIHEVAEHDEQGIAEALRISELVFIEGEKTKPEYVLDGSHREAVHFLAKDGAEVLGAGRLRKVNGKIKFERIAVLAQHRGRGIGRMLMDQMLEVARERFAHLQPALHARVSKRQFYERLGWTAIGEPFLEAEIPHICFVK